MGFKAQFLQLLGFKPGALMEVQPSRELQALQLMLPVIEFDRIAVLRQVAFALIALELTHTEPPGNQQNEGHPGAPGVLPVPASATSPHEILLSLLVLS